MQDGISTSTIQLFGCFPHPSYAPIETGLGFVAKNVRKSLMFATNWLYFKILLDSLNEATMTCGIKRLALKGNA